MAPQPPPLRPIGATWIERQTTPHATYVWEYTVMGYVETKGELREEVKKRLKEKLPKAQVGEERGGS